MNDKFLIFQIVQFIENNAVRAYEELIKLIAGGSMLSNGELDKIDQSLRNTRKIISALKENLRKVREIDEARMNVIEVAKKNKVEV